MMHKKIVILIMLINTLTCFGQDKIYESEFYPIQYVNDLKKYDGEIYCAGYTFQTANYDGYATDAYLNKYNDTLGLIWSLKISRDSKNIIRSIIKYNNKIYALLSHGKTTNSTSDLNISLYIISMNGTVEETVLYGKMLSSPTNIIIKDNDLFFGYSEPSTIYYSSSEVIPVLLKYNLVTKNIEKFKGVNSGSYPEKAILNGSTIFLVGQYKVLGERAREQFLFTYNNGIFSETILHTDKSEYLLDSYVVGEKLVVLTQFSGVYGDLEKYIKFQYVDIVSNKVTSKIIYFKELKWDELSFTVYSTESSTWLIVDDKGDVKSKSFVLMDSNGNIKLKADLNGAYGADTVMRFIIDNGKQISDINKSIKIKKLSISK